jgi:hypothetical protein
MSTRTERIDNMQNELIKSFVEKYPEYTIGRVREIYLDYFVIPDFDGTEVADKVANIRIKPDMITRHIPVKQEAFIVPTTKEELGVRYAVDTTYKIIYFDWWEK